MLQLVSMLSVVVVVVGMGRRMLPSTLVWQRMLQGPLFDRIIDASMYYLFGWTKHNVRCRFLRCNATVPSKPSSTISPLSQLAAKDKPLMYSHIYSYSSVKCVVHWFQMIKYSSPFSVCLSLVTPLLTPSLTPRVS